MFIDYKPADHSSTGYSVPVRKRLGQTVSKVGTPSASVGRDDINDDEAGLTGLSGHDNALSAPVRPPGVVLEAVPERLTYVNEETGTRGRGSRRREPRDRHGITSR